jgi:hypothetical protein
MYHWTNQHNLPIISTGGLKINQANNYLNDRIKMVSIYGCNPICLSTSKSDKWADKDYVLIEVLVDEGELLPDIFSMVDKGAYLEEDHLWFSKTPKAMRDFDYEDGVFYYSDLLSDPDLINCCVMLTKTACIDHNIDPGRLHVIRKKIK